MTPNHTTNKHSPKYPPPHPLLLSGNPHHSGSVMKEVDWKHTPSLLSVAKSVTSCSTTLCTYASPALSSNSWARHFRVWRPKKATLVLRGMALLRITWRKWRGCTSLHKTSLITHKNKQTNTGLTIMLGLGPHKRNQCPGDKFKKVQYIYPHSSNS